MKRAPSLLITVSFALVACSDAPTRTEVGSPLFEIVDAVHNSGNEHFFFLPPMVSNPVTNGTFDASLEPVVEICELALCGTSSIASFTTTTGPGSETVRLSTVDEHYIVNWHTDQFGLDPAVTYRIRVRVGDTELGHADVDVVSSGRELKNIDTDEYVALKDGRTLPIKFRIEEDALVPPLQWIELSPSGELPSGRRGASGVLDAAGQLIVFGGENSSGTQLNDLWQLANADGIAAASWTEVTSAQGGPPSPRSAHTAVYDANTDRMIVYGGYLSTTNPTGDCSNEVWVLTNASGTGGSPEWTKLSPSGSPPVARGEHSAVYDASGNRLIVYGGNCGSSTGIVGDVWVLSNANGLGGTPTWSQLSPTGGPVARDNHGAVYDATNNRMLVFGGRFPGGNSNDVWALANANGQGSPAWTQLLPSGTPPAARANASAVYDPASNRLTVFGGEGTTLFNDVWLLSNANGIGATPSWQQLAPSGTLPAPRRVHVAVYSRGSNRMTIFAGIIGAGQLSNDVWVLTHANGR